MVLRGEKNILNIFVCIKLILIFAKKFCVMSDLSDAFDSLTNSVIAATNVALAANTSYRDRQFAYEQYLRQVEDNRENWRMQNEYNSPKAQMARLDEAGLNPNLIYGTGAVGNSSGVPAGTSLPSFHSTAVPQIAQMQLSQMYLQNKALATEIEGKDIDNANKRLAYLKESENAPYYKDMAEYNFKILTNRSIVADNEVFQTEIKTFLAEIQGDFEAYLTNRIPPSIKDNIVYDPDGKMSKESHKMLEDYYNTIAGVLSGLTGQAYMAEKRSAIENWEIAKAKLRTLQEELKLYPAKLRSLNANAAYDELKLSLANQGININDPMWARIIGLILNRIFPNGSIDAAVNFGKDAVNKVSNWWNNVDITGGIMNWILPVTRLIK